MAAPGSPARNARAPGEDRLHQAVFEALPDACAVIDAAGRIQSANPAWRTWFGPAGAPGRRLAGLFDDPLDVHAAPWRRAGARPYPARLRPAEGPPAPAFLTVAALPDGLRLVTVRRDEAAPERARSNPARLTDAFDAPGAGAFGMDLTTGEGQVSGFLAAIHGLPDGVAALSREAWRAALGPADRAALDEALAAAHGRLFAPVRFTAQVADASTGGQRRLRYELSVAGLDAEGRPARLTGAVSDITAAAAQAQARRDAERRLAVCRRLGADTAWWFDPQTGEGAIEGPLADRFAGGFGWRAWTAVLGSEPARSLDAALSAAQFGAPVDLVLALEGDPGRVAIAGELLESGQIAGFMAPAPDGEGAQADAREAAASAAMSAWTYDIAERRLRLSGPVLSLLGLPGPEHAMDIEAWRARVPEDDRAQMDAATRSLQSRGVADVEYRVRAENGELIWLSLRGGISEQTAGGEALRFSGFLSEVGARKRLERELAERERQLADAVDAGLIGIWTYDYASRTQTARGRVLDWMGKPRDAAEVRPGDWMKVIHPDDQPALKAAFAAMAEGAPVERLDLRLRTPDGWRWGRTHGGPLDPGPDGAPRRAAGVIIDIHAERAFAEALHSEKERFEAVYRQAPALLHSIGPDGRTLMVSDYWLERMGHARESVIGAPGWAFMEPESARRIQETVIPTTLERGWVENEPVVAFTASGERLELRLSAFLERGADGAPVAAHGVFSDVTDLKAAQHALEDHAAALERSNRELNRFATVASHDLQEPLRKISAFSSLLRRRLSASIDPESDQALEFLVDAAGRMRVLIDDLLAYSRASSRALELKPVGLTGLVDAVVSGLDLQIAEAGAEIRYADLPDVTGDEVLLGLLFQNLLGNALKYHKADGVTISITARAAADGLAAVTVADDGIGFDPALSEKIFEPFARLHTREAYSGTGIGLAICQQAAERMGGRIDVTSAPGAGSAFTVCLPLAEPGAHAACAGA